MRKILMAFLMLMMVFGPVLAGPESGSSPHNPRVTTKTGKKTTHKKTKAKKSKKKSKKGKKRGKGPKEADPSELGSEIDDKAVTIDLQGK